MPLDGLEPGLKGARSIAVDDALTVPSVAAPHFGFVDMPPVFATAFLVAFVEWTCIEVLRPFLGECERTVGVHVDLSHGAATPVGMKVTAEVELVEMQDRKLRFKVLVRDEVDVISEGFHERYVIDVGRFMARLERKQAREG